MSVERTREPLFDYEEDEKAFKEYTKLNLAIQEYYKIYDEENENKRNGLEFINKLHSYREHIPALLDKEYRIVHDFIYNLKTFSNIGNYSNDRTLSNKIRAIRRYTK